MKVAQDRFGTSGVGPVNSTASVSQVERQYNYTEHSEWLKQDVLLE